MTDMAGWMRRVEAMLQEIDRRLRYTGTPWQTPSMGGGWAHLDARTVQFCKDSDGWVNMRGLATGGSGVICNLPVGYRAENRVDAQQHFPVVTSTGYGQVSIWANGNIVHLSGGVGWVDLSPIRFKAA